MRSKGNSHGHGNSHGENHGSQDHGGHGDTHGGSDHGSSLINVALLNGIGNGNDISIPVLNGTKLGIGDVLSDNLHIYDSNIASVLFDDVIGKAGLGLDALASVQHVLDGTLLVDLPDLFDHFGV